MGGRGKERGHGCGLLAPVCAYCKYTIRENGTYSNEALHIHGVRHTRANLIHLYTLTLVRPLCLSSPTFLLRFPSPPSLPRPPPFLVCNFVQRLSLFSSQLLPPTPHKHVTSTFSPWLTPTRSIMHSQYLPRPVQSVRSRTFTFKIADTVDHAGSVCFLLDYE